MNQSLGVIDASIASQRPVLAPEIDRLEIKPRGTVIV
jgi:hypothetical protein